MAQPLIFGESAGGKIFGRQILESGMKIRTRGELFRLDQTLPLVVEPIGSVFVAPPSFGRTLDRVQGFELRAAAVENPVEHVPLAQERLVRDFDRRLRGPASTYQQSGGNQPLNNCCPRLRYLC